MKIIVQKSLTTVLFVTVLHHTYSSVHCFLILYIYNIGTNHYGIYVILEAEMFLLTLCTAYVSQATANVSFLLSIRT